MLSGKYLENKMQIFNIELNFSSTYNKSIIGNAISLSPYPGFPMTCNYSQTGKNQISVYIDFSDVPDNYYYIGFSFRFDAITTRRILQTTNFISQYSLDKPVFIGTKDQINQRINSEQSTQQKLVYLFLLFAALFLVFCFINTSLERLLKIKRKRNMRQQKENHLNYLILK